MHVILRRISVLSTFVLLSVFCLSCSALTTAAASTSDTASDIEITEVVTEIGENSVRYPQLFGMDNADLEQSINNRIVDDAKIVQRLITLSTLQQGGIGLSVSYSAFLHDSLFSAVISAKGMMENLRSGHAYTAFAYDLVTGKRLELKDFFTDPDAAVAWMEEQLLGNFTDDLSNYLEHADVTPLPVDSFAFDQNGITFYYPYSQFSLLTGYSGAVQFQYGELQAFLISDDDSIPSRLGVVLSDDTDAQIREKIEAIVAQGTLPYLPVSQGDSIAKLIDSYRLTGTPDKFPGGRYLQFEDPSLRQILILTDALTSGYEASVVEGILAKRMNLYGIQTGVTPQSRWHEILGEPMSVEMDASLAADYGLPAGTADYYMIADLRLMLYADEHGVLYAVRISK